MGCYLQSQCVIHPYSAMTAEVVIMLYDRPSGNLQNVQLYTYNKRKKKTTKTQTSTKHCLQIFTTVAP